MSTGEVKKETWRLSQVARKLNVGIQSIVSFLVDRGDVIEQNPNAKITANQFRALEHEFATSAMDKEEASLLEVGGVADVGTLVHTGEHVRSARRVEEKILIKNPSRQNIVKDTIRGEQPISVKTTAAPTTVENTAYKLQKPKVVGKVDITPRKKPETPPPTPSEIKNLTTPSSTPKTPAAPIPPKQAFPKQEALKQAPPSSEVVRATNILLKGTTVVDKIELKEPTVGETSKKKRPRNRIVSQTSHQSNKLQKKPTEALSTQQINENIKTTLAKLSQNNPSSHSKGKFKKGKRTLYKQVRDTTTPTKNKVLQTTEFVSVRDLASLMDIGLNELVSTCMQMGMLVSTNQRLDSEEIIVLADEFGYEVQFSAPEEEHLVEDESEAWEDTTVRAPVVTVMGHTDHGKTSLLDFIRNTQVTAKEAGGITQHIGAYEMRTKEDKKMIFLDTPGHAAFTAMRARGARLTDVAIIVVAADDNVMPQTEEAINHVKVAGVPYLIAVNKVDKDGATPEKIREQLSKLNVLVEEWGGKVQSQDISAKTGEGVQKLLEKVLLEADILELKANPKKIATGSVIEASLDKGRGYVANLLVQNGTLHVGDTLLAGLHVGKIKAMFDHFGERVKQVGPSTPIQILGLDGPPRAGDKFRVVHNERDAREVANKRQQIARQQNIRTKKHTTLDEIGRRLALGAFKELNVIIKGDVDGSVEALSDELIKLSTEEVQLNIIHKAVGQISESDVLLATSSDAIIIGFQVRPSESAKQLASKEQIEIRLYSIIFDTINEIKDAIKGMHTPKVEEVTTATLSVLQIFKLPKIGIVVGCIVKEGVLKREHEVRVIRDGIVVHQGVLAQLKRFKEVANEAKSGQECGLSIKDYKDFQVNDVIEGFTKDEIETP